ncbi:XRE family transcriptional regulator [Rhodoferax lacus]|uniref:XRE family transcriptional regulator n=1 Tax=Rhodoferax lacus TaxID=2184758 RepID=A0A3E1R7M2_9BURK|nr:helix-turn-helix transcriptional regulator [Rhodoferax lacus]RFO94720.1 XRE family transcriptional regulator [Rhodoferax lacus]
MNQSTHAFPQLDLPAPSGEALKAARMAAGLSQVEAATLMGYPVQAGSRGGLQSRTWQALESSSDPRNMPGPIFALFLLLTGQHATFELRKKNAAAELLPASKPGQL